MLGAFFANLAAKPFIAGALRFLKGIPWQVWLALAVLISCWLWGNHRYDQGVADQKAKEQKIIAAAVQDALAKEREAAKADAETKRQGDKAIADRRKELDDAKANLPDQALTARQRARACAELRRSGKACPPAPTSR